MKFKVITHLMQPKLAFSKSTDLIGTIRSIVLEVKHQLFIVVLESPRTIGIIRKICTEYGVCCQERSISTGGKGEYVIVEIRCHIITISSSFLYDPCIGDTFVAWCKIDQWTFIVLLTTCNEDGEQSGST